MELAVLTAPSRHNSTEFDACLIELEAQHALIIEPHAAPDIHLEGCDLRVIALVDPDKPAELAQRAARAAAEEVWDDWLRQFLATHRCT